MEKNKQKLATKLVLRLIPCNDGFWLTDLPQRCTF